MVDFLASTSAPNLAASELCLDTFSWSLGHLTLVRLISFRSYLRVSNSLTMSSFSTFEMELARDVLNPVSFVVSKVCVSVIGSGSTKDKALSLPGSVPVSILSPLTMFESDISDESVSCLSKGASDESVTCLNVFASGKSVSCLSVLNAFELGPFDESVSCLSVLNAFELGPFDECELSISTQCVWVGSFWRECELSISTQCVWVGCFWRVWAVYHYSIPHCMTYSVPLEESFSAHLRLWSGFQMVHSGLLYSCILFLLLPFHLCCRFLLNMLE